MKTASIILSIGLASAQYNVLLYNDEGCGESAIACNAIPEGDCCNGGGALYSSTDAYDTNYPTNVKVYAQSSQQQQYCAVVIGSSDSCFNVESGYPIITGSSPFKPFYGRKRFTGGSERCHQADTFVQKINGTHYMLKLDSPEYKVFENLPAKEQKGYIVANQHSNMTLRV